MFKKYFSAVTLVKNLEKVRQVVSTSYVAITKILITLKFLETHLDNTKLGTTLAQYVPKLIVILVSIKEVIEKYSKYIGLNTFVGASSIDSTNLLEELDKSFKDLNELLKK